MDVYAENFDPVKGYHIYHDQNLLILKLENLDARIADAMQAFLGQSKFVLKKGNQAEVSHYSIIYKEVKQTLKFPSKILDEIYTSKYILHFYSQDEINQFRSRWC